MKAEEAKKEISQLRIKRQNAIDDARITYLEGFIAGSEYANEMSREETEKAYLAGMQRETSTRIENRPSTSNFNDWCKCNQEESNG